MHLIVATQRPSTNVITGIIKANLPTRIAFRVASRVDSKVILDHTGAESLLGKGDMLFQPVGQPKPVRIQGAFIEEDEIKRLVAHIKEHCEPDYEDIVAAVQDEELAGREDLMNVEDEYLVPCIRFALEKEEVSTSLLQRHFKIGYNRAACIVDVMEARGIISGPESGRRRKLLVRGSEVDAILASLSGG
jgi:S-DNA-T family DNA segregation ATPase FtsK/SpoIIIE